MGSTDPGQPGLSFRQNPFPVFDTLREEQPVFWADSFQGWVITRFEDTFAALCDPRFARALSLRSIQVEEEDTPLRKWAKGIQDASLLRAEGEQHRRMRGLVSRAFTPRAVRAQRPEIEAVVDERLARLRGRERVDIVADYCAPIPVYAISRILGIERGSELEEHFWRLSSRMIRRLDPNLSVAQRRDADEAAFELYERLQPLLEEKRRRPRRDLLSRLIEGWERDETVDENEFYALILGMIVGGIETTTSVLTHGIVELSGRPDMLQELRDDPSRWRGAVEELVRMQQPAIGTTRVAAEDFEFRGQQVKKGDLVVVSLIAGMRDPRRFEDPHEFDIDRDNSASAAFGAGPHYCIGASLARMELEIALRELFEGYPDLSVGAGRIEYDANPIMRTPVRLWVTLGNPAEVGVDSVPLKRTGS